MNFKEKATYIAEAMGSPRILIVLAQASFITWGIQSGNFSNSWLDVFVAVGATMVSEILFSRITKRKASMIPSLFSTAFGISLFFRATDVWFVAAAACIAIASKYILRLRGRHIFNPSNFAIVSLAYAFPWAATLEFTQWGNDIETYIVIAVISLFVSWRAGALYTSLSFLGSYTVLLLALIPFSPAQFIPHHLGLLGPTLVVFATLMITDPGTSPSRAKERICHGITAAVLYFALEAMGVRYAMFATIFFVSLANAIFSLLSKRIDMYSQPESEIRNWPSLMAAASALVIAVVPLAAAGYQFNPAKLSAGFVFRGIENEHVLRCDDEGALRMSDAARLGANSYSFGGAWGDYDGDGFDDLFISNLDGAPSALYRNNGDGTFSNVTREVGIPALYSASALFADYDNSGTLDLFVFGARINESRVPVVAFSNRDGRYTDVTRSTGFASAKMASAQTGLLSSGSAGSFADLDADGDLDLVVVTAGDFHRVSDHELLDVAMAKSVYDPFFPHPIALSCGLTAGDIFEQPYFASLTESEREEARAFIGSGACIVSYPEIQLRAGNTFDASDTGRQLDAILFKPGEVHVYENRRGTYIEHEQVSDLVHELVNGKSTAAMLEGVAEKGYQSVSGRFFQPISFDYNGDLKQDIFITSDFGSSLLLKNVGNFRFEDSTSDAGLDYSGTGMGVAVGDFDQDHVADITVTNVRGNMLYRGREDGTFSVASDTLSPLSVSWGTAFIDYNLDAKLDIAVVNGDIGRSFSPSMGGILRPLFREDSLYLQDSAGEFSDATGAGICPTGRSGRALAIADFDNNGTPDMFRSTLPLTPGPTRNELFVNSTHDRSYLKVNLRGRRDNYYGVGARIEVTSGDSVQTKIVFAGSSYYSGDSSRILFGLGTSTDPVMVRVVWPSGTTTVVRNVAVNQEITVEQ